MKRTLKKSSKRKNGKKNTKRRKNINQPLTAAEELPISLFLP